jgi:hypothetical protein
MGVHVTFHSDTKIIQVDTPPDGDGAVFVDVKTDIYSDGKEDWKTDPLLNKFLFPVAAVGGNPLPGSKALGSTFFLEYGWKIKPYEATHQLQINGNLYARDGSNPYLPTVGTFNVQIINQVSSLVDSTIQQLSEIEYASFGGGIWYDEINGTAGTAYPAGTQQQPVNNAYDAFTIASERGFNTGFIINNMNVPIDLPLAGFKFVGSGRGESLVIIPEAATVQECIFHECEVTGYLDGENTFHECLITDLYNVSGYLENCVLSPGIITLSGSGTTHFLDCWSGQPGTGTPTIDMNGSGQALAMRNYNGGIKLTNKTGIESVSIDMNSGQVKLADTITNGTIVLRGVGKLTEDFSTGSAVIINQMINRDAISHAVWEEPIGTVVDGSYGEVQRALGFGDHIHLDSNIGVVGTAFPIGTHTHPVNNMSDAIAIANVEGISTIRIDEDVVIGATDNVDGFTLIGAHAVKSQLTFTAGCSTTLTQIEDAYIVGTLNGPVVIRDSVIDDLTGFEGIVFQTMIKGSISIAGGVEPSYLLSCYTSEDNPIEVNMAAAGSQCHIRDYTGGIKIINKTGPESMTIALAAGTIILDGTVTNGTFIVAGNATLVDNSTGTTLNYDALLNKEQISDVVWDEALDDHTTAGSMGEAQKMMVFNGQVHVDTNNGIAGTAYPLGTKFHPVDNILDAILIAQEEGLNAIYIAEDVVIPSNATIDGFHVRGSHATKSQITVTAGASTQFTQFTECHLTGTLDGWIIVRDSIIEDLYGVEGIFHHTMINSGIIHLSGTKTSHFLSCYSGGLEDNTPEIDFGGSGRSCAIRDYSGGIKLINKTGPEAVSLDMDPGTAILDSTVTSGEILVRGITTLVDNSSGDTVVIESGVVNKTNISDAVWDEIITDHLSVGSTGLTLSQTKANTEQLVLNVGVVESMIEILTKYDTNRTRINTNTNEMYVYDDDCVTVLRTFKLYDSSGVPSTTEVCERRPINATDGNAVCT